MIKKIAVLFVLGVMLFVVATSWGRVNGNGAGPSSGPDMGGKIAFVRGGAIWVYENGEQRQQTGGPQDREDKRDAFPSFSPDGTQIVYTRIDEGFSDLYILDVADPSNPVAITDHRPQDVEVGQVGIPGVQFGYNELALWADYPAWSPTGDEIAFTSDVGTEYPNLRTISPFHEPVGSTERLARGIDFSRQTVEHPSWSPIGMKIAVANYETAGAIGQIWVYNVSTETWLALTDSKEGAYDPAWSPDGEWIAFAMREGGKTNIYVVPTDPQLWEGDYPIPVQLTNDGASRSPAWSPDGTKLAFLTLKDPSFDLYVGTFGIDANGNPALDSPQRLTDNANVDAPSGVTWGP